MNIFSMIGMTAVGLCVLIALIRLCIFVFEEFGWIAGLLLSTGLAGYACWTAGLIMEGM